MSRATPIILTTAGPALRTQQLEALRAGAWELRGDPLDMEELVLRLGVYVQGKLEVDRLGAEGLVDRASGLYNDAGMTRRSSELAALTVRQGLSLACAVFQPADGVLSTGGADRLALAFRRAGRISDALCRTGPAEFTVFAPATDETGAEGLVQRISDAVSRSTAVKLRSGVSIAPARPKRPSGARSSTSTDRNAARQAICSSRPEIRSVRPASGARCRAAHASRCCGPGARGCCVWRAGRSAAPP